MKTLVWFRLDLRLDDHPALAAAAARGDVVPVYVWSPEEEAPWSPGAAGRWWLHHSLAALDGALREKGSRLIVRKGPAARALTDLAREAGAGAVVYHRRYEPALRLQEKSVEDSCRARGLETLALDGALLFRPEEVKTGQGGPYQVFTPFWNSLRGSPIAPPLPAPRGLASHDLPSEPLESLGLLPSIPWDAGFHRLWTPGAAGAHARAKKFLAGAAADYPAGRDIPEVDGTSRLSPHLHFGEVGLRRLWAATLRSPEPRGTGDFRRELAWREFAHHLLFHFPRTTDAPLRPAFQKFPWRKDPAGLRAWQKGRTGFPIVDAGMRQLWATGWMHNRVRMIAASFLVKDLMASWREGAAWFWDTLVDADLPNNTLGWQWSAGCGADAAPYFRVFNPALQGEKFDPDGTYVKRWVPELSRVPARWIHRPWEGPAGSVPADYPSPVLDHGHARLRALEAFRQIKP